MWCHVAVVQQPFSQADVFIAADSRFSALVAMTTQSLTVIPTRPVDGPTRGVGRNLYDFICKTVPCHAVNSRIVKDTVVHNGAFEALLLSGAQKRPTASETHRYNTSALL
jgi:hypothetical protein